MIGSPEEIATDLMLASLSTVFTEAVATLTPEQIQSLRDDLANGKRMRFVIDIASKVDVHMFTTEEFGLDTKHIVTIVDDRPRSSWASDLIRPAS